jgi:hypothetical protein
LIHGIRSREIIERAEEFCGKGFRVGLSGRDLAEMVRAERNVISGAEHAAALAAGADMLTVLIGVVFSGHGNFLSDLRSNEPTR